MWSWVDPEALLCGEGSIQLITLNGWCLGDYRYRICPDQSLVINSEADLKHHALMLGNGRGPHEVGPKRTYQGYG